MKIVARTIIKRDGRESEFDVERIRHAVTAAFCDVMKTTSLPPQHTSAVEEVLQHILSAIEQREQQHLPLQVETIQDLVENALMSLGHYDIARSYILYRHNHKQSRESNTLLHTSIIARTLDGRGIRITPQTLMGQLNKACADLSIAFEDLSQLAFDQLYDGMPLEEVSLALVLAARSRTETDPQYSKVAARLVLHRLYDELFSGEEREVGLQHYFATAIQRGVDAKRLDPRLYDFDLPRLAEALDCSRDDFLDYLGVQTLYDRYLICDGDYRIETPQILWMRVAMGLSLLEGEQKNDRAIEYYELLSNLRYVSATPTLFNAGTSHPQLSSCYITTIDDDLEHIFKCIGDNAKLSKWAGGLGNDWTSIRATGALIQGTGGKSQGVVPFLKVANDTALAVNQGGKRKGVACAYLEPWHLDFEEFLELRKNTGDDRRRTHDMHTAAWIPDLFMKRVERNGSWTLFSPDDVPDLHNLYGEAFEKQYCKYEEQARQGKLKLHRVVNAQGLWRTLLSRLFETGHPWVTFKDPSNLRSPQDHVGVVHSSNLCTEILLNTSAEEVAVCNLGSINLGRHVTADGIDREKLQQTVTTAVRMLDNVIDINFYPIPEARTANLRHRPVGLGQMGFQDALYTLGISYASEQAVAFADEITELISYHAICASAQLAEERGKYSTYKGSKWDRGLLPIDTVRQLANVRGDDSTINTETKLDWNPVRDLVKSHGMRNSCVMAIAPTATIANIAGATPSIEPSYKHLYVKSNLSGEFTVLNERLVSALRQEGLWTTTTIDDLKYYDGSIAELSYIPEQVRERFKTAFEIEPQWLIDCASRRQKWIDQGQSLNLYFFAPKGKTLSDTYFSAWRAGLKTTYYARTLAATQVEKSTTDINQRGIQPRWMKNQSASSEVAIARPQVCNLDDDECESCQ